MSKYKFSESQQDLLKVAKYNQEISNKLLEESKQLNAEITTENDNSEKFLSAVENKLGIVPPHCEYKPSPAARKKPVAPDWEQLTGEAKDKITYDVDYEDLLTSEEFANAYRHIDEINEQFAKKTGFKKVDWIFLVTAIALQCTRQYAIDPWIKKYRPKAGANDEKGRKGNANGESGSYYVETEKILVNKVPFDTVRYSSTSPLRGSFLKGSDHRTMTLGHDPLLGWFFGTANILTSTITNNRFVSAHVKYEGGKGNVIDSLAPTHEIFTAVGKRFANEGLDGKAAVGCGVIREAIHLKSDIGTKDSLSLPGIPALDLEFAKDLAKYGIDTASVGTEIGLSCLINSLISMVHRLFYDKKVDDAKLFEVRTRKVLLYSNTIASTSNIIAAYLLNNPKIIDVGGLLVTIMRLFSDIKFICRVKQEFIESALDVHFQGIIDELEQMYKDE